MNIIVKDREINKKEIIKTCQRWLKTSFGFKKVEWAYQNIKPRILIEKLLLENDGNIPKDFKFHMFHGECEFIEVNFDRFIRLGEYLTSFFDSHWNRLYKLNPIYEPGPDIAMPDNLDNMLLIARKLSKPFDYVRVDLYNIEGKIFFGELTHYPFSGTRPFDPPYMDFELGEKWNLKLNLNKK